MSRMFSSQPSLEDDACFLNILFGEVDPLPFVSTLPTRLDAELQLASMRDDFNPTYTYTVQPPPYGTPYQTDYYPGSIEYLDNKYITLSSAYSAMKSPATPSHPPPFPDPFHMQISQPATYMSHSNSLAPYLMDYSSRSCTPPSFPESSTSQIPTPVLSPPRSQDASREPSPSPHPFPAMAPATGSKSTKIKKVIDVRDAYCDTCGHPIAKLLMRGTRAELDTPCDIVYTCMSCLGETSIATAKPSNKKRSRSDGNSAADAICCVCSHVRGKGGIVPKLARGTIPYAVELVCVSCHGKYQRCSDCGGGSGRVSVGKWRSKELFDPGRKTCRLPHTRIGQTDLELSIWESPGQLTAQKNYPDFLAACEAFWTQRVYARMAIPEVLDGTDPESLAGPRRTYEDVQKIIARGWPSKDFLLRPTPPTIRRYISALWTKDWKRRSKKAAPTTQSQGPIILDNIRHTDQFYDEQTSIVNLCCFEWDMRKRTLLLSSGLPFDAADTEERSGLMAIRVLARCLQDMEKWNAAHPQDQILPPEHMWLVTRPVTPLLNTKLSDSIMRRWSFFQLDEYRRQHPHVTPGLFTPPLGGHPWIAEPAWTNGRDMTVSVLARWMTPAITCQMVEALQEHECRSSKKVSRKKTSF